MAHETIGLKYPGANEQFAQFSKELVLKIQETSDGSTAPSPIAVIDLGQEAVEYGIFSVSIVKADMPMEYELTTEPVADPDSDNKFNILSLVKARVITIDDDSTWFSSHGIEIYREQLNNDTAVGVAETSTGFPSIATSEADLPRSTSGLIMCVGAFAVPYAIDRAYRMGA